MIETHGVTYRVKGKSVGCDVQGRAEPKLIEHTLRRRDGGGRPPPPTQRSVRTPGLAGERPPRAPVNCAVQDAMDHGAVLRCPMAQGDVGCALDDPEHIAPVTVGSTVLPAGHPVARPRKNEWMTGQPSASSTCSPSSSIKTPVASRNPSDVRTGGVSRHCWPR